ncbi:hypothetical protein TELCIR_05083 [Teladorsagia circumcincta]|uniref:Uncharacterized protein n=1 Tax=Teladorsagia circumcincta TaxID=45464 RepID=A0A2G9URS2_TELCI|nr:hypothetical protein TELCIR_05083 [Teladorsagia circumcincta]
MMVRLWGAKRRKETESNAVEFDEIGSEDVEQIGSVNPMRPAIDKNCSGCGAQLHCKDASLPGFLPEELLDKAARKRAVTEAILCRRCHLLKHHNFLLNVNVCPVDYESVMSCLRMNPEALVLLVVDVTDIPGSIHRQLPRIIGPRRPMIVIGRSLFNALLQSDLCKVRAVDLVERATTSVWPGTTLSLLKFPIMKPSTYRLELRRRRLLQHRAWLQKEMYSRKLMLQETGDPKYAVLIGAIQNTYKEKEDESQPVAVSKITGGLSDEESEPVRG